MTSKRNRRGSKRTKLPMATKKIDQAQNKKIVSLEKRVTKLQMAPEMKYVDFIPDATNRQVSTAGNPYYLNFDFSNGSGTHNARIGSKITCKYVTIRGYVVLPVNTLSDRLIRLVLLWEKIPESTMVPVGDPTQGGAAANPLLDINLNLVVGPPDDAPDMFAPKATQTRNRYTILYDKQFHMKVQTTAAEVYLPFIINKKLNRTTVFNDNPSGITNVSGNRLTLIPFIDNQSANPALINFYSRVYFIDF